MLTEKFLQLLPGAVGVADEHIHRHIFTYSAAHMVQSKRKTFRQVGFSFDKFRCFKNQPAAFGSYISRIADGIHLQVDQAAHGKEI